MSTGSDAPKLEAVADDDPDFGGGDTEEVFGCCTIGLRVDGRRLMVSADTAADALTLLRAAIKAVPELERKT